MKRYLIIICSLCICILADAQTTTESFNNYRQRLLTGYSDFRNKILDDYIIFLDGIWKEYDSFRGLKKNNTPKPSVIPTVDSNTVTNDPILQTPENPESFVIPNKQYDIPTISQPQQYEYVELNFYGFNMKLPFVRNISINDNSSKISRVWEQYQSNKVSDVIPLLKTLINSYGLNDWFTLELIRMYVDKLLYNKSTTDRITLQHYLLVHMGYDVRMARSEKQTFLLVPFYQTLYERTYIMIDNVKYYVFYDNINPIKETYEHIYTYELPDNYEKGEKLNLIVDKTIKLNSDVKHISTISDGYLSITCSIDKGVMEMLRHYPPMDVPCYAASMINSSLRKSVLQQVAKQIEGLPETEAVNTLIHFVQYAFDYATDEEQHGYEKPYFFEENFYYNKNDCEDRAIFFAYLVRNILGLDVHLIEYPGHECTAIHFNTENLRGDRYIYKNNVYLISDPTYIGASFGMCMPNYKDVEPTIELWY